MKFYKSITILMACLILLSCNKKNEYKVFIFSGQSNMVGIGQANELNDTLSKLPENLLYYRQCNPEKAQKLTSFTDGIQTFGPEVSFSNKIKNTFPNDSIIIIKCALGGTSLYNGFYPKGSNEERASTVIAGKDRYNWYSKLISIVKEATKGRKCSFEGIFWMQGERDCRFEKAATEYAENLKFLADTLRSDLNSPNLLFVSGRVNPPKDERYIYQDLVRKAHENLEQHSPPAAWINCDKLGKQADKLHYNTKGQLKLGELFAEKYFENRSR
ncbi:sialate O-acetylesterase [Bacteroidota bacterium]